MKKILSLIAVMGALAIGSQASAGYLMFGEDVNQGVLCKFDEKRIEVLAENERDCLKIGGKPTHQLSTIRKPLPQQARKHR